MNRSITLVMTVLIAPFFGCTAPPDYTSHMQSIAAEVVSQTTTLDAVIEAITAFAEATAPTTPDPNSPESVALVAVMEALNAAATADLVLVQRTNALVDRLREDGFIRD